MLVFISDLHLTDGTAFPSYLDPAAFKEVFSNNLASILSRRGDVKELKLVLLGDCIDLIRTARWFDVEGGRWRPKAITPWRDDSAELEKSLLTVLKNIINIKNNARTLEAIRALPAFLSSKGHSVKVETVYVPGNHDRLIRLPSLWREMKRELGGARLVRSGFYKPTGYKTLAFHGHQLDVLNRPGHGMAPLGDYIASLITAVPELIESSMKEKGFSAEYAANMREKFQRIDDIRPFSALLPWIISEVEGEEIKLKNFLKKFIFKVITKLMKDPFVREWINSHDKELGAKDEIFNFLMALQADTLLGFIGPKVTTLEGIAKKINSLRDEDKDSNIEKLLLAIDGKHKERKSPFEWEVQQKLGGVRNIVIGHTHSPQYIPIDEKSNYVNAGTWRKYATHSVMKRGFRMAQRMTFVVAYRQSEAGGRLLEQWNGIQERFEGS